MKPETTLPLLPSPLEPAIPLEETEGGLNVGQMLRTLQRKWLLIVGLTLVTTSAAAVKVLTDTPTYNGTLEILVQPITAETEVISTVPETLTSRESNQSTVDQDLVKILTSPSVLQPVVEEVQSRYPQFCRASVEAVEPAEVTEEMCYDSIRQGLQLSSLSKNSDILQITFSNPDSQKVITILNEVADAYLQYSLSSRQADISRGIEFVNQKLPDLQSKVNSLQSRLQSLRLDNDLIDPDSRGAQLSDQMSSFTQEQLEIEVELEQNRDVYEDLRQQLQQPRESNASSALANNPRYQTLLNSLLEVDAQIAEASTLYLDTSPDMQVLREQRQNLLGLLAAQGRQSEQEIISRIRELEARNQAIQQTISGLNANVDDLSGISRDYTDIQRELQVATENLTQFLSKKEALEIDAAQREIPWEIVTPPTDPQAVPVSLPQNLLLGGLLGLLIGVGAALLLDQSAGVIHNDDEIRRATRLPVLGRIPNQAFPEIVSERKNVSEPIQYADAAARSERNGSSRTNKVLTAQKTSANVYAGDPFSESFRSLYTNIRLLNTQKPIRSVAISSVMPGEGKSTVAVHLAETVASMGQRVLLVDADLRNPHIHTYLELSNEKGLTNLFSGESNPAVIQKFASNSSLYVIASGSASFEPTRLFSSRSMQQFVERIESKFDFIIYDTPPLLGQSDAYLIADNTDGLLLITKPGQLKQSLLDRAMEQLRMANINVLGLVNRER